MNRAGKLSAPFEVEKQRLLAANSNRPVLFEHVGFDQFKKLSSTRQIPTGAKWVAALGIIFGPEPKQGAAE